MLMEMPLLLFSDSLLGGNKILIMPVAYPQKLCTVFLVISRNTDTSLRINY